MRSIAISKSCCPTSVGAATRGREGGLVDHLGEVGPDHARGALGEHPQVRVVRQLHLADVDLQDLLPAPQVGPVHHHLAVEAPGAQQRLVEHLRAVGRGHDHDAGGGLEAVHLDEELVERLLALVVGGHGGDAAARLADRVELVDEDDAGGALAAPPRRGRASAPPRGPRTSPRTRSRRARRTAPPPRPPPPWRAASCRCRGGPRGAPPWGCARRGRCTSAGSSGSPPPRRAPPRPRRPPPRRRR